MNERLHLSDDMAFYKKDDQEMVFSVWEML
jgi:hypothetical protein